eukprot:15409086-Alexandrium_andersonii.AAC.1
MFGYDHRKLREMWGTGVENEEKREEIFEGLNRHRSTPVMLSCTAEIWSYGTKDRKHQAQVNVNALERA